MKIISWNVNGLRSNIVDATTAKNKSARILEPSSPLGKIIATHNPDIICFQETRLGPDLYGLFESDSIQAIYPYQYWSSASKAGARSGNRYSGTSVWSKHAPQHVSYTIDGLDNKEGRLIQLEFEDSILITTYVPNSGSNWEYRLNVWDPAISMHIQSLKTKKTIIYCGDNNIANKADVWFGDILEKRLGIECHKSPTDKEMVKKLTRLVRSKQQLHSGQSQLCGYTPQEQHNFKLLLDDCNLVDSYRYIHPGVIDRFTWFNIRVPNCLQTNKGWLIDRFLVSRTAQHRITEAEILYDVGTRVGKKMISDHLPILLSLAD